MNKLFLISVYILAFFVYLPQSLAQFDLKAKLPKDPEVKMGKLPNGLTYYIRKNEVPANKVQLRLVVNAGSVLEDPDQQGLAHMMEHMNFNGSKNFEKNELLNYLQSIGVKFGADLNAYTGFDETVYILPIPSDDIVKLHKGFTILEDWAGNASLDSIEINKERGVVLEESRQGGGADERMSKKYYPLLFNGSQYAMRLPIGKDSILQHFNPSSLINFYKTWYRPDLMAVVVVGDVDPSFAEREIKEHFGDFKNPEKPAPRPSIIPMTERKEDIGMVLTDKEQTINLLQIFNYVEKAPIIDTWGELRETIVEGIFNSIINQRLNELTQQANAPFLFANTSFGNFIRGYRAFISFAAIGDKPVKNAVDAMIGMTENVKKFGFLQSELDRAKASILNQTEKSYADRDKTESAQLVQGYINNYLTGTPIIGIKNRLPFLKAVLPTITLEELNGLSKKMENNQGKFALLLAPEKNKDSLPDDKELLALLTSAHKQEVSKYEEKKLGTMLMTKALKAGKIVAEKTNAALGTTDLTLSNGTTVTLKPTEFKNDEIHMDAWRWGGSHNFGLADKENAENTGSIIMAMGIKNWTPVQLRKFLAGKSVSVLPYINQYDEGIEGESSVKDFETFLQLMHLFLTAPNRDEQLFRAYINAQKGFVANLKSDPNSYFADTLTSITYKNSPWAPNFPTVADFNKISLDRVMNIYKKIYGNNYGMHFTFVGNIDNSKIKPLLEKYIGSLPAVKKENKFTDEGLRPAKGLVEAHITRGTAKLSQVRLMFTGDAVYSQDENLKLHALMDALNIKFLEKLREEMGGIYGGGMGGNISKRPYNHYNISVSFPCGAENVEKLTDAALELIKTAQEKGIEQSYLDKVKETLRKQHQDELAQNDYWLEQLSRSWIEKDDPNWMLDFNKKIDALNVADLQQMAKKYFNMNNYIKAVLNPEPENAKKPF